jgi:hypothetical protein
MSCASQSLLSQCATAARSARAPLAFGSSYKSGFLSGHVVHQSSKVLSISEIVTPDASSTDAQPKGFGTPSSTSTSSRRGSSRQQRGRHANASMEQDAEPQPTPSRGRRRKRSPVKPEPDAQQQAAMQAVASGAGATTFIPTIDLTLTKTSDMVPSQATACLVLTSALASYQGGSRSYQAAIVSCRLGVGGYCQRVAPVAQSTSAYNRTDWTFLKLGSPQYMPHIGTLPGTCPVSGSTLRWVAGCDCCCTGRP